MLAGIVFSHVKNQTVSAEADPAYDAHVLEKARRCTNAGLMLVTRVNKIMKLMIE